MSIDLKKEAEERFPIFKNLFTAVFNSRDEHREEALNEVQRVHGADERRRIDNLTHDGIMKLFKLNWTGATEEFLYYVADLSEASAAERRRKERENDPEADGYQPGENSFPVDRSKSEGTLGDAYVVPPEDFGDNGGHPALFDVPEIEIQATGTELTVCKDIALRQQLGIAKYGTSVADNELEPIEWLQHAYEECLDQAIYLKRLIGIEQERRRESLRDLEMEDDS